MRRVNAAPADRTDTTYNWVNRSSVGGMVKPGLVLRIATDANYILHHNDQNMMGYSFNGGYDNAAMMNVTTQGMRVPGVLTWDVTENLDSPTQTAKVDIINALPISQVNTTLTSYLPWQVHSPLAITHFVRGPDGNVVAVNGARPIQSPYLESNVVFRVFGNETITVSSLNGFPDPRVPGDENDNSNYYSVSATGVGSYFILIDQEVIRVYDYYGSGFLIPCGGRGINGVIQEHRPGATVTLLGFGPYTSKWAGLGYATADDYQPYKSIFRPGTCLVSYEGWGDFHTGGLSKTCWGVNSDKNYEFTGYWFVKGQETSLGEDGTPHISLDLVSPGYLLQSQKITPFVIQRLQNQIVSWSQAAFDDAGTTRDIPGDWADYRAWDPTMPGSYPLSIKTELAQHKAFFDHMNDSDFGRTCEFCQQEYLEYINKAGYKLGSNPIGEARAVGKHIYKESIRVYNGGHGTWDAGPIRTFGRLMMLLAMYAWENPTVGLPLAQRFTKIPNALWSNMTHFSNTGFVWNGTLNFQFWGENTFLWDNQSQNDVDKIFQARAPMTCPFEAQYDRQEFWQPIQDLADINRMTYSIDRRGYPVFIPKGLKLRGLSYTPAFQNYGGNGEWHMSWNASISNYTHNLDIEQVLTMAYVSGTTAFDSDFTIAASGTSFARDGTLVWHSSVVGNKEALAMTSGVQQIDTVTLDNLKLGLDWNTNPAGYSLNLLRDNNIVEISKKPEIPSGNPKTSIENQKRGKNNKNWVIAIQRLGNFFLIRRYINQPLKPGTKDKYIGQLTEDGVFGDDTQAVLATVQQVFVNHGYSVNTDGIWDKATSKAAHNWFETYAEYMKFDVWWYALGGYPWEYYVAAISGLPIPQTKDQEAAGTDSEWIIDQLALRTTINNWMRNFEQMAINYGNSIVDESINKASVRSVQTVYADPRIMLGDVIWLQVPGFIAKEDSTGEARPPFTHGVYVTEINRNMDLMQGTYKGTYSGYRYRGTLGGANMELDPSVYFNEQKN